MEGFFLYRLPDETEFIGGAGKIHKGISSGFVLSSFYSSTEHLLTIKRERNFTFENLITFQNEFYKGGLDNDNKSRFFPFPRTSPLSSMIPDFFRVQFFIDSLSEGEKAVWCVPFGGKEQVDLKSSLLSLSSAFPKAFVFCFYTPQSGLWIGASPELLLKKEEEKGFTVALAGTRQAHTEEEWDAKNLKEQGMVVEYIESILKKHNLSFTRPEAPISRNAGPIEHLYTPFTIDNTHFTIECLTGFLCDFSPTPALCGLPKEKAQHIIGDNEKFSRGYYGGFAGPFNSDGDFSFFVLLRALRMEREEWCMFAGGGITTDSNPHAEWLEVHRKASSILDKMTFIKNTSSKQVLQ